MHRLKNSYRGRRGVVVLGGPSLIESKFDLSMLRSRDFVVLVDTKVITPWFLSFGVEPDYWLLLFPEKAKDNSLQHFIYRAFLAEIGIGPFLKREYRPVLEDMERNREVYLEGWRPHKGPHKRYRWRPDVYLKDSPLDLMRHLPRTRIIANRNLFEHYWPGFPYANERYCFEQSTRPEPFDLARYYTPLENDGRVVLRTNVFINSAAIVLYALLEYLGFDEVYFLGMDMSMLGTFEYGALYTFKSMLHYRLYFSRMYRAFGPDYRPSRPFYLRPREEFEELRLLFQAPRTRFVRVVYEGFKYAARIERIPTITIGDFKNV